MQQATDEHAALHTLCAVLSPASYSDFRARIHELFEAGEVQGALALWASRVEVQHFPPTPNRNPSTQVCHRCASGFAPSRLARCEGRRGGYQFQGLLPHRRGLATMGMPGALAGSSLVRPLLHLTVSATTKTFGGLGGRGMQGATNGGSSLLSGCHPRARGALATSAELVGPCGIGWESLRQGQPLPHMWESCRKAARLESGPYAFPRGGGVTLPRWQLYFSLLCGALRCAVPWRISRKVAEDRVWRFRMTYSLQEDEDFAGAFSSWSEAMKAGGSAVADAWMEVAADVDDTTLLRAVDEAHMAAAAARQGERPPVIRYFKLSKPFYKARPKPAKAVQRNADDALARSLAEAFELCEAFKPMDATDQQLIEWRSFLRQLTARKAQKAEPATVKKVVRTVTELYQFQLIRGRAAGLADVGLIDLSSFLTEGTSAPSRALPALRWFNKHCMRPWTGRLGILLYDVPSSAR